MPSKLGFCKVLQNFYKMGSENQYRVVFRVNKKVASLVC